MSKMNMFAAAMAAIAACVGFYYYASPYENCLRAKEITSAVRDGGFNREALKAECASTTRW